jgi:hypothetical protein
MSRPKRQHTTWPVGVAVLVVLLAGCGGEEGKRRDSRSDRGTAAVSASDGKAMRAQLVAGAVSILSALDRYDEARASEQVFDRLVQWSHAAGSVEPRDPDPLIDTLPDSLRKAGEPILIRDTFDAAGDVVAVRDRCWLAAIAKAARRDAVDDLAVAQALFQWVVRSLAPVGDPPMVPSEASPGSRWFLPGEILLAGRASGPQRAWIFIELLRQAGLEGVMLATPSAGDGPPRPWIPAVVIGGEAYLFEPTYGLPVPGPGGDGVATLRQAASDPSILAALSLPERVYPVSAEDAAGVGVLVVADPWNLAARMARLDSELGPQHGVHVSVDASASARRAATATPRGEAATRGLWTFPWETLVRRQGASGALADELGPLEMPLPREDEDRGGQFHRPLFAGRVREFRGDLDGPEGAKAAYMAARPSRKVISSLVASLPEPQAAAVTKQLVRVKEDATYWLGLAMLTEGQFAAAEDYLARMTLEASPDSRWTDAARINLAAALVGLGRTADAAAFLLEDGSPQRFGSRLVARKLQAEGEENVAEGSDEAVSGPDSEP